MHGSRTMAVACFGLCLLRGAGGSPVPAQRDTESAAVEKWRLAVLAGDSATLASLYSTTPPARVVSPENKSGSAQEDVAFWSGWKAKGLTNIAVEVAQEEIPAPTVHQVVFQTVLTVKEVAQSRKLYVAVAQVWVQQGDAWRIAEAERMAPARLKQPLSTKKDLYLAGADAKAEIADAIQKAASEHKRILVDFGANWCFDCHVLDEALHSPEIAPVVANFFEVVHVDVGEMNKNLDVAKLYDIPLDRGIPAIAVLESDGKLLFSQKRGEFEAARSLAPEDILEFLDKWKPRPTPKN